MSRNLYPENWKEVAIEIKEKSNWRCSRCGLVCLRPSDARAKELDRSTRAKHTLQVHHWNFNPSDCQPTNLAALCSACHLWFHRYQRGNISPGQLSLKLDLQKF